MAPLFYNLSLFLLWPLYQIASLLHPKVRNFRRSRGESLKKIRSFFLAGKGACPVWLHASSVGELDQALGLLREIKRRKPSQQVIVSTFSLSVAREDHPEIDLMFRMPLDLYFAQRRLILLIRPKLFVTMTWDVFPNLLFHLRRLQIPAYLSSAALGENSSRLRSPWIGFHRSVYRRFTGIGCVDGANRERFLKLFPDPERVDVTGDSRYDTIFYKIEHAALDREVEKRLKEIQGKILILGSTYAPCDRVVYPALARLLPRFPGWKVLIFPHHVDEARLSQTEEAARREGIELRRFGEEPLSSEADAILVDRMGVLALAYRRASFCYVGGAFHHRVHNVAEPAALGCPVLTGPSIETSPEAVDLQREGLLVRCSSSEEFEREAQRLMEEEELRSLRGKKSAELMMERRGSSARFYDRFLKEKIETTPPCLPEAEKDEL